MTRFFIPASCTALLLASTLTATAQQSAGAAAGAAMTGSLTSAQQSADKPLSPAAQELMRKAVYDVASIHPLKDNDPHHVSISIHSDRNGDFTASGVTARLLLSLAWGIDESRIQGGPAWLTEDRFTIAAKPDEALGKQIAVLDTAAQKFVRRKMLQSLLADRFALKTHWITEQRPVIALEVAKNGTKLHASPTLPASTEPGTHPAGSGMNADNGKLIATRVTMEGFASFLTQQLHQLVQDQTGLTGPYDFTFEWDPDNGDAATANKPTLPTAVEEQLGLKLASRKAPVEVLFIDGVTKPSEN